MMDIKHLVDLLTKYNEAYRNGSPLVSDAEYDQLIEKLRERDPDNLFLNRVEPEQFNRVKYKHPKPMLSTEKAYTYDEFDRWLKRIDKAAVELDKFPGRLFFRITPKLDGLAGRDTGTALFSRGDGIHGYDISDAYKKGVVSIWPESKTEALGEIVMELDYFNNNLSNEFQHPRNVVVGIVSSDEPNKSFQKALNDKAVKFVPYDSLDSWIGQRNTFNETQLNQIKRDLLSAIEFPTDGLVCEVMDNDLREYLGHTEHHYRYMIAIKEKGETAVTSVTGITWQVGRTGNITPVMEVVPTTLSGATIRRVTAHNAGFVKKDFIGIGAEIEIVRSGEVIPKLLLVVKSATEVVLPTHCPSCQTELIWDNDFLKCPSIQCPDQSESRIVHWFRTIDIVDWFGPKTISKLADNGVDSLEKVYALTEKDFLNMGFGPGQAKNLYQSLIESKSIGIEDWKFLAAFGVPNLGRGVCKKILSSYPLDKVLQLTENDLVFINGIGDVMSKSIVEGLQKIKDTFDHMLHLGFTIKHEPEVFEASPVTGKNVVCTGTLSIPRKEFQASVRKLGGKIQDIVTKTTDILVIGESFTPKKVNKAEQLGITVMTESVFNNFLLR